MNKIYDVLSRLIIKSENIAFYVGLLLSRQRQQMAQRGLSDTETQELRELCIEL